MDSENKSIKEAESIRIAKHNEKILLVIDEKVAIRLKGFQVDTNNLSVNISCDLAKAELLTKKR